jgi:protocatechuate 3,4-dioxygenase alpha subunit
VTTSLPRPGPTPSQTVGPFFHDALLGEPDLSVAAVDGEAPVVVEGHVLDGLGAPLDDALVELWQVGEGGWRWARSGTDARGQYRLVTTQPGPVPHPSGRLQAPHLLLLILGRGLLDHLVTRAYLTEGPIPNDPVLEQVPVARRPTLLAVRDGSLGGRPRYRFDIRLCGEGETVFFAV